MRRGRLLVARSARTAYAWLGGGASGLREWAAMAFLYRLLPPRPTFAQDMSPAKAVASGTCAYEVVPMQLVRPG